VAEKCLVFANFLKVSSKKEKEKRIPYRIRVRESPIVKGQYSVKKKETSQNNNKKNGK
jgi:hypothetical protein